MTSEVALQRDNEREREREDGRRLLGGFFVNVKSRELMASSILYPRKTPGGGEERGKRREISQGEEEGEREREREMSWREEGKKEKGGRDRPQGGS